MDHIHQIDDGFVLRRGNTTYYTDNNFNVLKEYDFDSTNFTFDGHVVEGFFIDSSKVLNVKTGEITHFDFDVHVLRGALISRLEDRHFQVYDFETSSWYDDFAATYTNMGNVKMLRFNYKKSYVTDMIVKFKNYIYRNGKSILFFNNKIKVYEGELFSKERLLDFLHGKSRAYINDNYAYAIAKFKINSIVFNSHIPNHIHLTENHVLDVNAVDLYKFNFLDRIIGFIDDTLISEKGERLFYKIPGNEVLNEYERYNTYPGF